MDRPDLVSRVTPPKTTMLNTQALHPPIHHANGILPGPSPAAEAAKPRVAMPRTVVPTGLVAVLTALHRPPPACCVSQACLANPRSCRSAVKAAVRRARSAATAIASAVLPRLPRRDAHVNFQLNFDRFSLRVESTGRKRRARVCPRRSRPWIGFGCIRRSVDLIGS